MLRRSVILLLFLSIKNFDEVTPKSIMETMLDDSIMDMMEGLELSLLPSRSDIQNNMVVIGIRLSRQPSRVCIEIKQGKLLPGGTIDRDSEEWKACDAPRPFLNVDYVKIDRNFHYIDLDDVIEENDQIVTGVAFGLTDDCLGSKHIKLRVEYTRYNLISGQLDSDRTSSPSSTCNTNEITDADSSNNSGNRWVNSFIKLRKLNPESKIGDDIFLILDTQPVKCEPSAPLSGIGLNYELLSDDSVDESPKIPSINDYHFKIPEFRSHHVVLPAGGIAALIVLFGRCICRCRECSRSEKKDEELLAE